MPPTRLQKAVAYLVAALLLGFALAVLALAAAIVLEHMAAAL